jgi:hypothetical protein
MGLNRGVIGLSILFTALCAYSETFDIPNQKLDLYQYNDPTNPDIRLEINPNPNYVMAPTAVKGGLTSDFRFVEEEDSIVVVTCSGKLARPYKGKTLYGWEAAIVTQYKGNEVYNFPPIDISSKDTEGHIDKVFEICLNSAIALKAGYFNRLYVATTRTERIANYDPDRTSDYYTDKASSIGLVSSPYEDWHAWFGEWRPPASTTNPEFGVIHPILINDYQNGIILYFYDRVSLQNYYVHAPEFPIAPDYSLKKSFDLPEGFKMSLQDIAFRMESDGLGGQVQKFYALAHIDEPGIEKLGELVLTSEGWQDTGVRYETSPDGGCPTYLRAIDGQMVEPVVLFWHVRDETNNRHLRGQEVWLHNQVWTKRPELLPTSLKQTFRNPPRNAINERPFHKTTQVGFEPLLSWQRDQIYSQRRKLYFTDQIDDNGDPIWSSFIPIDGDRTHYKLTSLKNNTEYFWRVDEENNGGATQGYTWSFQTMDHIGSLVIYDSVYTCDGCHHDTGKKIHGLTTEIGSIPWWTTKKLVLTKNALCGQGFGSHTATLPFRPSDYGVGPITTVQADMKFDGDRGWAAIGFSRDPDGYLFSEGVLWFLVSAKGLFHVFENGTEIEQAVGAVEVPQRRSLRLRLDLDLENKRFRVWIGHRIVTDWQSLSGYTHDFEGTHVGFHLYYPKDDKTTQDLFHEAESFAVSVSHLSEPYKSQAVPVPAMIEAEDYDQGGEGGGYHDTDDRNECHQAAYRFEGVDVQSTSDLGGGYNIGYIEAGEWMNYSIQVNESGYFDIKARVASPIGGEFAVDLDWLPLIQLVKFEATAGGQDWMTVSTGRIYLRKGQHVLRIRALSAGWNLNWLKIVAHSPAQPPPYEAVK